MSLDTLITIRKVLYSDRLSSHRDALELSSINDKNSSRSCSFHVPIIRRSIKVIHRTAKSLAFTSKTLNGSLQSPSKRTPTLISLTNSKVITASTFTSP